eukprot:s34_g12.t1
MDSPKGLVASSSLPSFASAQPGGPWVNRRDHLMSVGKTVAQPPLNEAAAVAWKARRKAGACLDHNLVLAFERTPSPWPNHASAGSFYKMWKIVGGSGKGGLLVRTGEDLTSPQLVGRFRNALHYLLQKSRPVVPHHATPLRKGSRLHFRLFSGLGPWEGWITLTLHGKVLAEKVDVNVTSPASLDVVVDCRDGSRWFRCRVPSTTTVGQLKELLRREETWPNDAVLETDAKDRWDAGKE